MQYFNRLKTTAFYILTLVPLVAFGESVIIHETAPLGETGKSAGAGINRDSFIGTPFTISKPVKVTAIGGHMVATQLENAIFGAIVPVPAPDAVPAVPPLEIDSIALAWVVFTPEYPSSDLRVPLSIILPPGNYALIFGSGFFGANFGAAIPAENLNFPEKFVFFTDISTAPAGYPLGIWTTPNSNARYRLVVEGEYLEPVDIDIKPGSDPNCFNLNGHGVIPLAIFGSADIDVNYIDTETLLFNGLGVRVRANKGPQCSIEYVNEDEYSDMVCQFEDDVSQWSQGTESKATLTGTLLDETPIIGFDSICIVQ